MSPGIPLTHDPEEGKGNPTCIPEVQNTAAAVKRALQGGGEGLVARMVAKGLILGVGHRLPAVRCS